MAAENILTTKTSEGQQNKRLIEKINRKGNKPITPKKRLTRASPNRHPRKGQTLDLRKKAFEKTPFDPSCTTELNVTSFEPLKLTDKPQLKRSSIEP